MGEVRRIDSFRGEFRFLSNFHPSRVRLACDQFPNDYRSVEHAFQAAKTLDSKERKTIREAASPGRAKKLGQTVVLRPGWDDIKLNVMRDLIWYKFTEHPRLRAKLLATEEDELIEGNTWCDEFWGVDAKSGRGENHLGKLLMETRGKIRDSRMAVLYAKRVAPELDLFEDMLKRARIQYRRDVVGQNIVIEIEGDRSVDITFGKNDELMSFDVYGG